MLPVDQVIRSSGLFLRRRDLLPLGYSDGDIRSALARKRIFRVRQGWYSVPDAPEDAVRAVRVGGRLTSFSALESWGLRVPRQAFLHVAVPATGSRLRSDVNRSVRLRPTDRVKVHWVDRRTTGDSRWRVPIADALLAIILAEERETAVACCSAALHKKLVSEAELDVIFARASRRIRPWRSLASGLDEAHGETIFRLRLGDVGIPCIQQPVIRGVGRLDFRVAPHTYIEIDGRQHDPGWTGPSESTWERDLDRVATMVIRGDRVLRFGYRQLYTDWPRVLAAVERAIADDLALTAYRRRHPYRPRINRKRRRSAAKHDP